MGNPRSAKTGLFLGLILTTTGLGACNTPTTTGSIGTNTLAAKPMAVSDAERDCLGRAMYFESNRSDAEGLLAVGTVVMNRLEAAAFPNGGICAVVGQPRQFAAGVLTKPMTEKDLRKVAEVTDAVLDGQRHPKVGRAMYFHTAGRKYPYDNMHYVAVAGGNAFYEKRKAGAAEQAAPPVTMAFAAASPTVGIPEAAPTPTSMPPATAASSSVEPVPAILATAAVAPVKASPVKVSPDPIAKTRVAQAPAVAPPGSLVSGLPIPTYSAVSAPAAPVATTGQASDTAGVVTSR